jgi:stringent starvation protein B
MTMVSTKPYLIRAIYEWCVDQGFTPYLATIVDERTRVPPGYAKDGQIVLNVGPEATHQLAMENEFISFQARFGGVQHSLLVPVANVLAIYARENGQGMAFPVPVPGGQDAAQKASPLSSVPAAGAHDEEGKIVQLVNPEAGEGDPDDAPRPPSGPRPALKRVK